MIEFEVVGDPAGQGSKRHVGNGVMVEMSKKLKPWRSAVAEEARLAADNYLYGEPLTGPLSLAVEFRFPMPASRPAKVKRDGMAWKTSAPDLDKLIRGVGDALKQGGLIRDDALLVSVMASKKEVVGWTGAVISIRREYP